QAASINIAGITALQGVRDKGKVRPGQKVLVNGASGGVGTFAVQLAKNFGAAVTGVCSTRNVALVQSLGADHVIDYTREDFTKGGERYDLIVDTVGNHPLLEYRRVLAPNGMFILIGAPNEGRWLGGVSVMLKAMMLSPFVSQQFVAFLVELDQTDVPVLGDLIRSGELTLG